MAQDKTMTKTDDDQPRDEDGRFIEKDAAAKSSGASQGSSKSKESTTKSSGGAKSGSKAAAEKSTRGGSGDQRSKSR